MRNHPKRSLSERGLSLLCAAVMVAGAVLGNHLDTSQVSASEQVLVCSQNEHTHGDGCYQKQLTCGQGEHTHCDGCRNENGEIVCGQSEHTHTDGCYTNALACGQSEHTHADDCYTARTTPEETLPDTTAETQPQTMAETQPETPGTQQTTAETQPETPGTQQTGTETQLTATETQPATQQTGTETQQTTTETQTNPVSEGDQPSVGSAATETPSSSDQDETATEAKELKATISAEAKYAVAQKKDLVFETKVAGGTEPYTVKYEIKLDGKTVYEQNEFSERITYCPKSYGVHTIYMEATDAAGKTGKAECSVPVAADETENDDIWRQSVQSVTLTGDYAKDIAAIARTQLGNKENKKNFIINKEGTTQYYSRYGQWYGDTYEEWSAMFAGFCAAYAQIPEQYLPREKDNSKWVGKLGSRYTGKDGYTPQAGDLVFFGENPHKDGTTQLQTGSPAHVGIVVEVNADAQTLITIEGNAGGEVSRQQYSLGEAKITGYMSMAKVMELAGTQTEEETSQESGTESETETASANETETESEMESESETETGTESETEMESETETGKTTEYVTLTTDNVILRAQPSVEADVVAVMDSGAKLEVLDTVEAEDAAWYEVLYRGTGALMQKPDVEEAAQSEAASDEGTAQTDEKPGVEAYVRSDLADVVEEVSYTENTLSYSGSDYTVTVSYGEDAQIPENAELSVREIPQGTEEYESYYAQTLTAMVENTDAVNEEEVNITFARYFDIAFVVGGEKLEPSAAVDVKITYNEAVEVAEEDTVNAVHFAENGVEVLNTDTTASNAGVEEVAFTQESFSVTGTVVSSSTLSSGDYIIYVSSGGRYYALTATGNAVQVNVANGQVQYDGNDTIVWSYANGQFSNTGKYLNLSRYSGLVAATGQRLNIAKQTGRNYYKVSANNRYLYFNGNSFASSNSSSDIYFAQAVESGDITNDPRKNQIILVRRTALVDNEDSLQLNSEGALVNHNNVNVSNAGVQYVKYAFVFLDENGNKMTKNGQDDLSPDGVDLSSLPTENIEFDVSEDGSITIDPATLGTISVPGFTYYGDDSRGYAYFWWSGNQITSNGSFGVRTIKNFGQTSDAYPGYKSFLGYSRSDGGRGNDYNVSFPGVKDSNGAGYDAYNPTGVLRIVLKKVSAGDKYTSYFVDAYTTEDESGNGVTIAGYDMNMDWDSNKSEYYGTLSDVPEDEPTTKHSGYRFVGWYDSKDADGNGTGNKIAIPEDDATHYNHDAYYYARWEPTNATDQDKPYITVQKTFTGLSNPAVDVPNFQIVLSDSSQNEVATLKMTGNSNNVTLSKSADGLTYTWTIKELEAGTYYLTEKNHTIIDQYTVTTTVNGVENNGEKVEVRTQDATYEVVGEIHRETSCAGKTFDFAGNNFIAASLTNSMFVVWTEKTLSASERKAIVKVIGENTDGKISQISAPGASIAYFSTIDKIEEGIDYHGVIRVEDGKLIFSESSQWRMVCYGKYTRTDTVNAEIEVANSYEHLYTAEVTKTWSDGSELHSSDSVYVGLYKAAADGSVTPVSENAVVELNNTNNWNAAFSDKLYAGTYSVKELVAVESGYAEFTYNNAGYQGVGSGTLITAGNGNDYEVSYGAVTEENSVYKASVTNTLKTSSFEFTKVSYSDQDRVLEGAEFKLEKLNANGTVDESFSPVLKTSGQDGKVNFSDLKNGTYRITETKAPSGYSVSGVTWTITVNYSAGTISVSDSSGKAVIPTGVGTTADPYTYKFVNYELYKLPSTGSRGIYWYLIGGMLLMMAASLILYKTRCKEVLEG